MTAKARYLEVDRAQLRWDVVDLESLLVSDHRARIVWAFVEGLELSAFCAPVKAREGERGRPPRSAGCAGAVVVRDLGGGGSARHRDRLCQRNAAYRWLWGGVPVNCHGLSDFRFDQAAILDRLLTESLTALLAEGVVKLAEIAIDGTKARANAGKVRSGGRTSWRDWKNWPVSWSRNLRRRRRATRRRARTGGKRRSGARRGTSPAVWPRRGAPWTSCAPRRPRAPRRTRPIKPRRARSGSARPIQRPE